MGDFLSSLSPDQLRLFQEWTPFHQSPGTQSHTGDISTYQYPASNSLNENQWIPGDTLSPHYPPFYSQQGTYRVDETPASVTGNSSSQFPENGNRNLNLEASYYGHRIQESIIPAMLGNDNTALAHGGKIVRNLSRRQSEMFRISPHSTSNGNSDNEQAGDDEDYNIDSDIDAEEELLQGVNKRPLWQQMGFASYGEKAQRTEYIRRRRIAKKALSRDPHPFKISTKWSSVKNRATRELLIKKVQKALEQWDYSADIALNIILSLTHNRRRNRNRERNADIGAKGGVIKKGRPPTHGRYCGKRKPTEKKVTDPSMSTQAGSGSTSFPLFMRNPQPPAAAPGPEPEFVPESPPGKRRLPARKPPTPPTVPQTMPPNLQSSPPNMQPQMTLPPSFQPQIASIIPPNIQPGVLPNMQLQMAPPVDNVQPQVTPTVTAIQTLAAKPNRSRRKLPVLNTLPQPAMPANTRNVDAEMDHQIIGPKRSKNIPSTNQMQTYLAAGEREVEENRNHWKSMAAAREEWKANPVGDVNFRDRPQGEDMLDYHLRHSPTPYQEQTYVDESIPPSSQTVSGTASVATVPQAVPAISPNVSSIKKTKTTATTGKTNPSFKPPQIIRKSGKSKNNDPVVPYTPDDSYKVMIHGQIATFQFSWPYSRFREEWNDVGCWFRYPLSPASIVEDAQQYQRFLAKVRLWNNINMPDMWAHSKKDFNDTDSEVPILTTKIVNLNSVKRRNLHKEKTYGLTPEYWNDIDQQILEGCPKNQPNRPTYSSNVEMQQSQANSISAGSKTDISEFSLNHLQVPQSRLERGRMPKTPLSNPLNSENPRRSTRNASKSFKYNESLFANEKKAITTQKKKNATEKRLLVPAIKQLISCINQSLRARRTSLKSTVESE